MISLAVMASSQACENSRTLNFLPSANASTLMDDRLQAVSSRYRYSEQGFEALILPEALLVCHSLVVVSNCRPGSPQNHAASAMAFHRSLALYVFTGLPVLI